MNTFEVYTTGGGYYVWDLFNYLAMFTNSGVWSEFLTLGILVGVVWKTIEFALAGSMDGLWRYIVVLGTVGALGVSGKSTVVVIDSTYPLEIYGMVEGVPLPVAFVASITSKPSHALTRRMEALLATPGDLTYQKYGMLVGATLLAQASRYRAVTPSIQNNLVNFMENCMIDGANVGLIDIDTLARAPYLPDYISANSPGALAYYDEVSDSTVRCSDGWEGLASTVSDEVENILLAESARMAPADRNGVRDVFDPEQLRGSIESFQTMMGIGSMQATGYIQQSMLIAALDDASGRLIANSGNSAAMDLYARARAESQTRSSYQVVGSSALKWVPILKITFEALYLGVFPVALLLMMTPMATAVVKGYFGGFLWLSFWEPLSAILHTIFLKSSTDNYRQAMATVFPDGTVVNALTWANHLGVHSVEADVSLAAGYLMMSVPFLSLGLLWGANRMGGLATSMLNVSQGAAIETGKEIGTGNLSLGNTSMNTMRANQYLTSSMVDTGRQSVYTADGGFTTLNADNSRTYQSGSAQSNVGMSAMVGQTVREELSDRSSNAWRSVQSSSQELTRSLAATTSRFSEFARSASVSNVAGGERGFSTNASEQSSAKTAFEQVEGLAERHNISTDLALAAAISAGAGLPAGLVKAGLQADGTLTARSSEAFELVYNDSKSSGLAQSVVSSISSQERSYAGSSNSDTDAGTNSLRSNYDTLRSESQRFSSLYENAQALDRANSLLQSKDYGYNQRITDAVISELSDRGYTPDQISSLVNPKTTAGIRRQEEVVSSILPDIISELGIMSGFDYSPPPPVTGGYYNTGSVIHTPVDPSNADVMRPDVGNRAFVEGLVDGPAGATFDRVNERLSSDLSGSDSLKSDVDSRIAEGTKETDRNVAGVFGDRLWELNPLLGDSSAVGGSRSPSSPSQLNNPSIERDLSAYERDVMIRTIIGEAANEGPVGQSAVAHTIRNRVADNRWGDDPAEVSLQSQQFSAWNRGAGGNSLPTKYNPGDPLYDSVGSIVDRVWSGEIQDPTGGATFYYSPAGMDALVAQGAQSNRVPNWSAQENADRGSPPVHIGGHIFTGRVRN